jgi:cytochrome c biogenesis protein CcmG/thiol:disulfide interchange protein DsbE
MKASVRKRWVGAAAALLLLAGCDRNSTPGNIGKAAPVFAIGDGVESVDLAKLKGKVIVLNLWATWCAPCVEELPSLLALQKQMPELAVVGVSTDQDEAIYRKFLLKHDVTLLTVRDASQKINEMYGTVQIPETYIIDRQGILRRKFIGAQNWTSKDLVDYLNKL